MIPPLAIIQARLHSTRLERKMLLDVGGHPLLWWAWTEAWETFNHVVIACPFADAADFIHALPHAEVFGWPGDESDVLGRLHACAHEYADDPATPIVRITPDDFPIDVHRERCTLAELDEWNELYLSRRFREHIGWLFDPRLEINTQADLEEARRRVEQR